MKKLNEYLIDTNYNENYLYDSNPTEQVKKGSRFTFNVSYQPLKFIDVGLYGSYQFAKLVRSPRLVYIDPTTSNETYYTGNYSLKTDAFGVGISSNIYFNRFLNFDSKESVFLKKLILAIEASGGIGFSKMNQLYSFKEYPEGPFEYNKGDFRATDFQGRAALKFGYKLFDKSVKSSLGFKLGYQFYKTSTLTNSIGKGLTASNSTNLDFSGPFFGIFINLSK